MVAMRERVDDMSMAWRKLGYELGLGFGIAQGLATIGAIGFEGRFDYGTGGHRYQSGGAALRRGEERTNPGKSQNLGKIDELVEAEVIGELRLKGLRQPDPGIQYQWIQAVAC